MNRPLRAVSTTMTVFFCLSLPAWAWNKAGHMVSAAIAYRDLKKSSPEVVDRCVAILKKHPEFETRWQSRLENVTGEDRDLLLFMLAARWPDDVRGNPDFDRPPWHFIDFPYKPSGQPASVQTAEPDDVNIVSTFKQNLEKLEDGSHKEDKAVALCWIFHQIGDVHQPLHTVSLFTTDYHPPKGDRGGTRFYIRAKEGSHTISLHAYWDNLILGSERFQTVRNRATEISLRPEFARSTFPELSDSDKDFESWAKSSFKTAVEFVYRQGDLAGSQDRNDGEVLPEDYSDVVQPIAYRQIALAGYRLADLLRDTVE